LTGAGFWAKAWELGQTAVRAALARKARGPRFALKLVHRFFGGVQELDATRQMGDGSN
jgi:hypothetical protein